MCILSSLYEESMFIIVKQMKQIEAMLILIHQVKFHVISEQFEPVQPDTKIIAY